MPRLHRIARIHRPSKSDNRTSMPNDFTAKSIPSAAAPPADYRSRRHTLGLPNSLAGRLGLHAQTLIESLVAHSSRLPDVPVYRTADFPWEPDVRSRWREIRRELDEVMVYRDRIPSFHEILKEAGTITHDDSWKTYFLVSAGRDCTENARRCPQTMQALRRIPGVCTAFFSILAPGKHIPAHRGAYNGVLRYHLGLLVPEPRERCRIRIANEIHTWGEGEGLIFDDSFNHEVWNDTEGYRVVLFVDFARPLRQPFHWFNERLLNLAPLAPFLREAGARQKAWERTFYGPADARAVKAEGKPKARR
jgi:beta-hydroxylase